MGKKKIKIIDSNTEPKKEAKKGAKQQGRLKDMSSEALREYEERMKKEDSVSSENLSDLSVGEKTSEDKKDATLKAQKKKRSLKRKQRSQRYKGLLIKIDKKKLYPIKQAVELLTSIAKSKMDETVDVHFSTLVDKLTGSVKLPHGTGKKQKIVIANDLLIDSISNGKIDFDILIATPQLMPKIAKVARILGPKGLMPSPKTGTVSDKPEEAKKKLEGGELRFKTEPKAALMHITIGKISFGSQKILENLQALLEAVKITNIKQAHLTSTHSPSIKLELTAS